MGEWTGQVRFEGTHTGSGVFYSGSGSNHYEGKSREVWDVLVSSPGVGTSWSLSFTRSYNASYDITESWDAPTRNKCDDRTLDPQHVDAQAHLQGQGSREPFPSTFVVDVDQATAQLNVPTLTYLEKGPARMTTINDSCNGKQQYEENFTWSGSPYFTAPNWVEIPLTGEKDANGIPYDLSGSTEYTTPAGGSTLLGVNTSTFPGKLKVSWNLHWLPAPEDPCAAPTISPPTDSTVTAHDWRMRAEISPDDGLVLRDVRLGTRYMAREISLPYVEYTASGVGHKAQLQPSGPDSRLTRFDDFVSGESLVISASYTISEGLPKHDCLIVSQVYRFMAHKDGDHCEPTGQVMCSRFYPIVKYDYEGHTFAKPPLTKVALPERLNFMVNARTFNSSSLMEDGVSLGSSSLVIAKQRNPLLVETAATPIVDGSMTSQDEHNWDNYHQTWHQSVEPPEGAPPKPGCPECVHIHWRWGVGTLFFSPFNPFYDFTDHNWGLPRIPDFSQQSVSVGIVKYHPDPDEIDPVGPGWRFLVGAEQLGASAGAPPSPPPNTSTDTGELVFWYEGQSQALHDEFFIHGGFFARDALGTPKLKDFHVLPKRWWVAPLLRPRLSPTAGRRGTTFAARTGEAGTLLLTIRRKRGLPASCRRGRPGGEGCRPYLTVGRLSQAVGTGLNRVEFSGRLGPRPLRPGRYRARAVLVDLVGKRSKPKRVRFVVMRRPRTG